jgi:hypothetical protein
MHSIARLIGAERGLLPLLEFSHGPLSQAQGAKCFSGAGGATVNKTAEFVVLMVSAVRRSIRCGSAHLMFLGFP